MTKQIKASSVSFPASQWKRAFRGWSSGSFCPASFSHEPLTKTFIRRWESHRTKCSCPHDGVERFSNFLCSFWKCEAILLCTDYHFLCMCAMNPYDNLIGFLPRTPRTHISLIRRKERISDTSRGHNVSTCEDARHRRLVLTDLSILSTRHAFVQCIMNK